MNHFRPRVTPLEPHRPNMPSRIADLSPYPPLPCRCWSALQEARVRSHKDCTNDLVASTGSVIAAVAQAGRSGAMVVGSDTPEAGFAWHFGGWRNGGGNPSVAMKRPAPPAEPNLVRCG
jgi:hypothetical protein